MPQLRFEFGDAGKVGARWSRWRLVCDRSIDQVRQIAAEMEASAPSEIRSKSWLSASISLMSVNSNARALRIGLSGFGEPARASSSSRKELASSA